jgi:hypothetical protein
LALASGFDSSAVKRDDFPHDAQANPQSYDPERLNL